MEYWCSNPTLLVPHHCIKSDQSGPSIKHSEIKAPQPYTAKRHTNGPHFHSVMTLICALKDAPTIACNNQIAAIQALHQAIQRWSKPTLPVAKVPQVNTHPPTHTQQRTILCPMHRPTKDQAQDLFPRVVIQKRNTSLSTPKVPSTKNNYEPVAQHTRSRVPHTVDPPPPRVKNKQT